MNLNFWIDEAKALALPEDLPQAKAIALQEGSRFKYVAINPERVVTSDGEHFYLPEGFVGIIEDVPLETLMDVFHDAIEKYGYVEIDPRNLQQAD